LLFSLSGIVFHAFLPGEFWFGWKIYHFLCCAAPGSLFLETQQHEFSLPLCSYSSLGTLYYSIYPIMSLYCN
jgi:hypothetical protein